MADDPILKYEAELQKAQLAGDVATLDRLLDEPLVFTGIDGKLYAKGDDLALHRSGRIRMDPGARHVLRLGAVVVVNIQMDAAATIDGTETSGALHPRLVRAGRRVVAGHMSAAQV